MSESFVVTKGGSIIGGGAADAFDNVLQYISPGGIVNFINKSVTKQLKESNTKGNNESTGSAIKLIVGVLMLALIVIIWLSMINGFYAWRKDVTFMMPDEIADQGFYGRASRAIPSGGAMGAGDTRVSYPLGGDVQGMTTKKYDTFLSGGEAPIFNDVPNYILRKENSQKAAINAYAKLRTSTSGAVPDWADYWRDWQSSSGQDFNRALYNTSAKVYHDPYPVEEGMISGGDLRNSVY